MGDYLYNIIKNEEDTDIREMLKEASTVWSNLVSRQDRTHEAWAQQIMVLIGDHHLEGPLCENAANYMNTFEAHVSCILGGSDQLTLHKLNSLCALYCEFQRQDLVTLDSCTCNADASGTVDICGQTASHRAKANFPFIASSSSAYTLLFRQTISSKLWTAGELDVNKNDEDNDNFARLSILEHGRSVDGRFYFKLNWPNADEDVMMEWSQTSNPLTQPIAGYESIHVDYTGQKWGGLEPSTRALMDGSVSSSSWYYAVGAYQDWHGGIPAYAKSDSDYRYEQDKVELYVVKKTTVKCHLTVDNHLTHLKYNGKSISTDRGDWGEWTSTKEFSFNADDGAYLEIWAEEASTGGNGCHVSGLLLECDNGFGSSTSGWEAIGSSSDFGSSITGALGDVCQTTSGFYLHGQSSDAQKIWPSNGKKFAYFRAIPYGDKKSHKTEPCLGVVCPTVVCADGSQPPVQDGQCCGDMKSCPVNCQLTIDNQLTQLKYNGGLYSTHSGDWGDWASTKKFSFSPVDGAYLEIWGQETNDGGNGCQVSGLLLECDNGFVSSTTGWEAIGSSYNLGGNSDTGELGGVCQTSSKFSMHGQSSNAQKIWPSNGKKYAYFRAVPFGTKPAIGRRRKL